MRKKRHNRTKKSRLRGKWIALEILIICVGLALLTVAAFNSGWISTASPVPPPETESSTAEPSTAEPTTTEPETTTLPPPPTLDIETLEGKKLVALTFDDGPQRTQTTRLLDFLKEQGVHVTFFMVGVSIKEAPEIVRRAAAEGHQVASHTYNHKDLTKLGPERLAQEIGDTAALLEELTGYRPTAMRPPYGAQNAAVQAAAGTPLILWSIDPKDWSTRDADKSYTRVLSNVRDGDIVLLHDLYRESVEAAERIIPALKEQGYTFVTVDQLLAARGGAKPGDVVYNRPGE